MSSKRYCDEFNAPCIMRENTLMIKILFGVLSAFVFFLILSIVRNCEIRIKKVEKKQRTFDDHLETLIPEEGYDTRRIEIEEDV